MNDLTILWLDDVRDPYKYLNGKKVGCAKWLIGFCKNNNIKLPKFYVHSANPNNQRDINGLLNSFNENISFNFNNIVNEILKKCH